MKYSELPVLEPVGYADSPESLAVILSQAVATPSAPFFTRAGRAIDGPCSCHLLSRGQIGQHSSFPRLPRPYLIDEMAQEFFNPNLIAETRCDPSNPPTPDSKKGWKVSRANFEGKPFVVVEACWTSRVKFPLF